MQSEIVWKPNQALPYMIHSEGHPLDGEIIIWPEVGEFQNGEQYFAFMTNREHVFRVMTKTVVRTTTSPELSLLQTDGYGSPAELRIAIMTDNEFSIFQAHYKKHFKKDLIKKEDLVSHYIKCLDD